MKVKVHILDEKGMLMKTEICQAPQEASKKVKEIMTTMPKDWSINIQYINR